MTSREPVVPAAEVAAVAGAGASAPRWGLPDAAVGWLMAQVGAVITGSAAFALSGADEFDDLSLGWLALGQIGLWLGFLLVPVFVSRVKGSGLVPDFGLKAKLVDPLGGIPAGFALQVVVGIALWLFYQPIIQLTSLTWEDVTGPVEELTDKANDSFSVAMLVLIVGIGAPIFEELFYRGLMLRAVEKRLGTAWAVAISSLVFGISHFNLQIPGLVLFGVMVALLTVRTGRLGPAIAVHVGFNMTAVIGALA